MIKSVVNVDAPRPQVFHALTDFAQYNKWVPGCERCQIVDASGNFIDVEITINSIRRLQLVLRFQTEPVHSIRFRMTKGKDIRGYSGTYRLMDSADRRGTVVIAELEIEAGFLAPKFIVDMAAGKALRDVGAALKAYVRRPEHKAETAAIASGTYTRKKRDKRVVRVVKTPTGYQVRFFGESFFIDKKR
jgi:carbon monoxide dehydrogenase subunit G